jgi:hypothetical protein
MDFETAMGILVRSAGDELVAFLGTPRAGVSQEAIDDAARAIGSEFFESDVDEQQIGLVAEAVKRNAFRAWWWVNGDQGCKDPAKRADLIAFIEGAMGEPIGPRPTGHLDFPGTA